MAGSETGQEPGPVSGNYLFLQAVGSAQKALGGGALGHRRPHPPHIGPLENVRHWSWENAKDGKRPESLDT